jgi:hypothetical protein
MDHAKKVVLVDEKLYNSLQERAWERPMTSLIKKIDSNHQLSWKRPLEQRVKSNLSKQLHSLLNSATDDNVKSKLYGQTLSRFNHIGAKLPDNNSPDVNETEQQPRPQQQQQEQQPQSAKKKPRFPVKKKQSIGVEPISTRPQ